MTHNGDCLHAGPKLFASAMGRKSGGPWCSDCGKDISTLADAVTELADTIRQRTGVDRVLGQLGRWMDRYPRTGAVVIVAFAAAVCTSIILCGRP